MKKIFVVIISFCFVTCVFSQLKIGKNTVSPVIKCDVNTEKLSGFKKVLLKNEILNFDTLKTGNKTNLTGSKKSPGLALLYSLIVPGLGHVYTNRFDVGKYFLISEASLWLGFAAFTIYSNWLLDDAYDYAVMHAGITLEGKDDDFFINIANYDNVEQYNNDKLQRGQYDKIYFPQNGWGFYWDQIENRKKYREDKLAGDRIITDRLFIVGAILVNHVLSAVSAIILTNKYNSELKKSSGGFALTADVMKYGSRVNGLKLKFTKWF